MLTTVLRATALMAFALAPLTSAAAEDAAKLVESVPPQIADVVSGGSWSAGKQGGLYRAFVVMSESDKGFGASIYLQWLALSDDSPVPTVVQTVPIKEANEQKLPTASIEIDGEENKDNEIILVVSGYDFDSDKDILLFVKAGQPGTYTMEKTPPKSLTAPPQNGAKTPPKED